MRRIFRSAGRGFLHALVSTRTHTLLLGASAGAVLLAWCFQWIARLGTSLPVVSALSLGVLVGLELGFRPWKSPVSRPKRLRLCLGFQGLLLLWTLGFSWAIDWQTRLLGAFSPLQLANPALSLAVCFGFALILITPAVYILAKLAFCQIAHSPDSHPSPAGVSLFLIGLALGILSSAFVLAPAWGLLTTSMIFIAAGAISAVVSYRWCSLTEPQSAEPEETIEPEPATFWNQRGREVWVALFLICLGGLFAWLSRAVDQLMPTVVALSCAKWSSLVLGWSIGFGWQRRQPGSGLLNRTGVLAGFFAGAWAVGLAAAFPWLVDLCLNLTVSVSNVFWLTVCRLALVVTVVAPLGIVWGRVSAFAFQMDRQKPAGQPGVPLLPSAFLAGWLSANWVLIPTGFMPEVLFGLALAGGILALARLVLEKSWPERRLPRALIAAFSLMVLTSFFSAKNYAPQTSAQLLFSAPVFIAHQAELDPELLTALDDGRLIHTVEGQQGTYTLWKYRGVQYQIRQSGLPKGMASGNVAMCPDFSAEVLPAAMPLVLHERPATMLILGLGSGVPLSTALDFATQQVTCVESDPALIRLVKDHMTHSELRQFSGDPRWTILPLEPALMLRSNADRFDVILSMPHQPTVAQSSAYFTEAFYRDAAAKLADDGLFCQRFSHIDFGPGPLRIAARTMQSVFQDVVFLEMATGEMLLLGTNAPQGVAREELLERLQKHHVRRELATLGWDWSIPLNLAAYNHESLKEFADADSNGSPSVNTSVNGTLAFRLPAEMMRWGPKPVETHQALAPHQGRFAQWGGIDPRDPDLLDRLAEVTGQRKLMAEHPDEYWVYRKTVRDQVKENPRSVIVQVKGELPRHEIHEDDQRRLEYFKALAATFKHHPHRPEDIAKVESFSEPYDPLVTFFLHQEVAELHTRTAVRDYRAELAHRLYSVYYAAPADRSVRNVTAAIELLCDHPEAAQAPLNRWDHLNGLLQMMKQRWVLRAGRTPSSAQVALNDVDKSLAAVQTALKTMDELSHEAGIPAEDWKARRRFVEATVVHPLRGYRRQLLPFGERERIREEKKRSLTEG